MPGSLGAGGGDGAGGVPIPEREGREGQDRGTTRGQADRGRRPGERTGRPGPDLTLRYSQLVDVIGEERLEEEREMHYAEQRSRIRGTTSGGNWQQFRAQLENYMPSVRPGAQTALNAARSPFATYVARIHDRLHQTYHDFVQNLPLDATGPFADPNLRTLLEIVLNRDGTVHRVGVVRSSGLSMFDYGAYNAVMRGQPYPVAPDEILSGDGRIYMHWDFHRQQPYCHQSHARPYILPNIGAPADEAPDAPGVVCCSTGNHGRAIAYAAHNEHLRRAAYGAAASGDARGRRPVVAQDGQVGAAGRADPDPSLSELRSCLPSEPHGRRAPLRRGAIGPHRRQQLL